MQKTRLSSKEYHTYGEAWWWLSLNIQILYYILLFIFPENTFPLLQSPLAEGFTQLKSTFGIAYIDFRLVFSCLPWKPISWIFQLTDLTLMLLQDFWILPNPSCHQMFNGGETLAENHMRQQQFKATNTGLQIILSTTVSISPGSDVSLQSRALSTTKWWASILGMFVIM